MNKLLREHVAGTAFVLSLGKTHVEALVEIDLVSKAADEWFSLGPACNNYSRMGLVWRGLVVQKRSKRYGFLWKLTDAGCLVLALLHEAGMYSVTAKDRSKNAAVILERYNRKKAIA